MAAKRRWKVRPARSFLDDDEEEFAMLTRAEYEQIDAWTKAFWEGWAASARAEGLDPAEVRPPLMMPAEFVFMSVDCFADMELSRLTHRPVLVEASEFSVADRITLLKALQVSLRNPWSARSIEILNGVETYFPPGTDRETSAIFDHLRSLAMGLACKGEYRGPGKLSWHPDYKIEK